MTAISYLLLSTEVWKRNSTKSKQSFNISHHQYAEFENWQPYKHLVDAASTETCMVWVFSLQDTYSVLKLKETLLSLPGELNTMTTVRLQSTADSTVLDHRVNSQLQMNTDVTQAAIKRPTLTEDTAFF